MTSLDEALIAAHAQGDPAVLAALYTQAAAATDDPGQQAFLLTHAHVFALEAGLPEAADLRARLISAGREAPLPPPRLPLR